MNERIKELAKQAVTRFDKDMDGSMEPEESGRWVQFEDLEKFAELIVEECIDVVLSSDPSPKMIAHEPYRTIMNNIIEHFGVGE